MNVTEKNLETRIAELERELAAANQRIAELEQSYEAVFAQWQFQRENVDEAERTLATAREALTKADDLYAYALGAMNGGPGPENQLRCANAALAILKQMRQALAQIDQPQKGGE